MRYLPFVACLILLAGCKHGATISGWGVSAETKGPAEADPLAMERDISACGGLHEKGSAEHCGCLRRHGAAGDHEYAAYCETEPSSGTPPPLDVGPLPPDVAECPTAPPVACPDCPPPADCSAHEDTAQRYRGVYEAVRPCIALFHHMACDAAPNKGGCSHHAKTEGRQPPDDGSHGSRQRPTVRGMRSPCAATCDRRLGMTRSVTVTNTSNHRGEDLEIRQAEPGGYSAVTLKPGESSVFSLHMPADPVLTLVGRGEAEGPFLDDEGRGVVPRVDVNFRPWGE